MRINKPWGSFKRFYRYDKWCSKRNDINDRNLLSYLKWQDTTVQWKAVSQKPLRVALWRAKVLRKRGFLVRPEPISRADNYLIHFIASCCQGPPLQRRSLGTRLTFYSKCALLLDRVVKLFHLSLFSYIANLIIASAQIARRGGLLIEQVCESKVCKL